MEIVEFLIRGKKERRVASTKAVGKLRKREAIAEEVEGDVRIVEGGKEVKNIGDLSNSFVDDVTRERDVAYWSPKEIIAVGLGPRHTTIERVGVRSVEVAAPDARFGCVEVKTDGGAVSGNDVIRALNILLCPNDGAVVQDPAVEK